MHFMFQHNQLVCLFVIFITQTISTPIRNISSAKQCHWSDENCENNRRISLPSEPSPLFTTATYRTTTTSTYIQRHPYSFNFKLIIIVLAGVCFGLGAIRMCFALCNPSRSSRRSSPIRRSSTVRPQVAIIEQNQFKLDLPPGYAEAIASNDLNESKLPSYDELRDTQHSRNAVAAAQM